MIIWQGFGVLAVLIPLPIWAAIQYLIDGMAGEGYYTATLWPKILAMLVSGAAVYFLGYKLNTQPGKVMIDPETNEKVELRKKHTLFWLPMQYWGLVIAIGGTLLIVLY